MGKTTRIFHLNRLRPRYVSGTPSSVGYYSRTYAIPNNPQGVAVVPYNVHPRQENRSGTTPFMAIENVDLNLPGYKHHLCHELESIFYVIMWHILGYRHKKGIYPTEANRYNTERKKWDLLKDWNQGLGSMLPRRRSRSSSYLCQ